MESLFYSKFYQNQFKPMRQKINLGNWIASMLVIFFLAATISDVMGQTNPSLHDLSSGDYEFTEWDAGAPAETYPANMRFWRGGAQDPGLTTEPNADYTGDYNSTSGSRMNGHGPDGFSWINTGTAGNLGAAVLGLNTTGISNVQVSWTGRTVAAGARDYRIRLQYRIGNSGSWEDVPGPIEYVNSTAGHTQEFNNINLPAELGDEEEVYLRWKYYQDADSPGGTRPRLGVTEITVTEGTDDPVLLVSPSSLTGLDYAEGSGPSASSSFELSGSNLDPEDATITITAPTNFEISLDDNDFSSSITVDAVDGDISSTDIFVRLVEGLSVDTYSGDLEISGGEADNVEVAVSGEVFAPIFLIYEFTGETVTPTQQPSDATTSNFQISAGNISYGSAQAGTWGGSGVPYVQGTGGWAASSIDDAKYFFFTIEADAGKEINLTNISFDYRRTGAGPENAAVEINGELVESFSFPDGQTLTFNSSLSDFNNLTEVEVRIYGWNGGGGDFRLNDVRLDGSIDDSGGPIPLATPQFDLDAGTYFEDQTVFISNFEDYDSGVEIYYTTNGDDPTSSDALYDDNDGIELEDGNGPITLKAIAIDASEESDIAERSYTFPQNVADIEALRGSDEGVLLRVTNEATFTAGTSFRNTKFFQDDSGFGIQIDDNDGIITSTYDEGDNIEEIIGTLTTFQGQLQLVPAVDFGAAVSTGNTVTPVLRTLDELGFDDQAVLVVINNVEFEDADGSNVFGGGGSREDVTDPSVTGFVTQFKVVFGDSDISGEVIPGGENNITGVVQEDNFGIHIAPRNLNDIEEAPTGDPLAVELDEKTDVDCNGDETGAISITVSGGVEPYSFTWEGPNGFSSELENLEDLAAGEYNLTVTDDNGGEETLSVTIEQPDAIVLTVDVDDAECFGEEGTITFSAEGGTGTLTLTVDGVEEASPFNGPADTYEIVATDENGCTAEETVEIGQPDELDAVMVVINVSAPGEDDGSIEFTMVSGGSGSFEYSIDGGSEWETNPLFEGLEEGSYDVRIRDANNTDCFVVIDEELEVGAAGAGPSSNFINNPEDIEIFEGQEFEVTVQVELNNGNSASGVSLFLSFDTDYLEVISIEGSDDWGTGQDLIVLKDEFDNMEGTIEYDVIQLGGPYPTNVIFDYLTITFNTLQATEVGVPTIVFHDLDTDFPSDISFEGESQLNEANSLEVDIFGCPDLDLSFDVTDVQCFGGEDGAIDLTVGAGQSPYSFEWSNDAETQDIAELAAGEYFVTVTDANGCETEGSATVGEPDELILTATAVDADCFGENGSITFNTVGGTGDITFTVNGVSASSPFEGPAGEYTIVATDENGCTDVEVVTMGQPSAVELTAIAEDAGCFGEDGEIEFNADGGTGDITFTVNGVSASSPFEGPAGEYTIVGTDENGCTDEEVVTIGEPDAVELTATAEDAGCFGENGSINFSAMGGSGTVSFTVNGDAASSPFEGPAGEYTIVATDENGCTDEEVVTIGEPSAVELTATAEDAGCFGEDGEIEFNADGGTGDITFTVNGNAASSPFEGPAGEYTIVATDENGCTDEAVVTIGQPDAVEVEFTINGEAVTEGGTYTFTEEDDVALTLSSIIGGVTPFDVDYSIDSDDFIASSIGLDDDVFNQTFVEGTYTVTINSVTDQNDCGSEEPVVSFTLEIIPAAVTVGGNIDVNTACDGRELTVTFYEVGTDNVLFTATDIVIDANGDFEVPNVPLGDYDVFVSYTGHLLRGLANIEVDADGDVELNFGTLIAGDLTGNNVIDMDDLTAIIAIYQTQLGDPDFDEAGDFDCNDKIDINDLTLLISNYNLMGDVPGEL